LALVLGDGILGHNALVYLALDFGAGRSGGACSEPVLGLRLRAVGENPQMVDAAGVSVTQRLRYTAADAERGFVWTGRQLSGVGAKCQLFTKYDCRPRFYGVWQLSFLDAGTLSSAPCGPACCLVFWTLQPFAYRGFMSLVIGEVPVQAIQALPYVLTVILLAGFIGNSIAPKSLGVPYSKER
jgi:ABC-type uncharacterized transport system permease subunit